MGKADDKYEPDTRNYTGRHEAGKHGEKSQHQDKRTGGSRGYQPKHRKEGK